MHWYLTVLKKYAVLDGRARRMEYWMFTLLDTLFAILVCILGTAVGSMMSGPGEISFLGFWLLLIYMFLVLMPKLSVTVRRLHDTGRSALWLFAGLIPAIGALITIILMVLDGDAGENEYGPDPKTVPLT
ncbi:DUF805 domain-containing protein [Gimesia fumaroli]|jgi:uncharacterized membrane protein YhaH (DUF805 family)|uniref:Inner membrane protein YhaH n=1 Tax=Gimesia fumaroli TaxID=2527976 RepID=A0A518IGS0_9PLAN|nr:DUF805 domain-containing protein [Gimesia fumaroli]QDV52250.1 Inner membrane protein YhaH [Gimesia fumaroli]